MINVSELLWLHNMGVPDDQIQALYNKEETPTPAPVLTPKTDPLKTEPAPAPTPAPAPAPAPAPTPAPAPAPTPTPAPAPAPTPAPTPAPDPTAATKQDPTSAALLEVIKSLQAQNAQLAAGKQPEGTQTVEDMLLSLI